MPLFPARQRAARAADFRMKRQQTLEDYAELLGDDAERWFAQQLPEIGPSGRQFHDGVLADNWLERKTKELFAVVAGAIARYRHCTRIHIKNAHNYGASQQ